MTSALFVSHTAQMGGAELFLVDLLDGASDQWEACFLSPGPASDRLIAAGKLPITLTAGKKMLSIRRESSLREIILGAADVLKVAFSLSREARKFDVICANSQKSLFVCAIAAKLARRPLIWFLHDIVTDPAYSSVNRRAGLFFANKFARHVAVNSLESGKAFVAAGGKADKVSTVYNGFHTGKDLPSRSDGQTLRQSLGLNSSPLIGMFGRLSEWKGQHILLQALAQTPDVQAVVVGAALFGEAAYEEELHRLTKSLDLSERVRFLGFRDDVASLMSAVDVVVHASTANEPFGRVVVEGMIAGRPVIATRGGGVTEIISDGLTGILVQPGDPIQLSEAIRRVVDDEGLASRLARAGQLDALERFSIDKTRETVASLLRNAV